MRTVSKLLGLVCVWLVAQPASALNIFACEPEWAALARALAPQADIYSATHVYQDPHYIEARPSLIARLRRADIAFCSGAALEEGWLPALQQRASNPTVREGAPGMFYAADVVSTIEKHQEALVGRGHVHAEGNPHLHLDPDRVQTIARHFSQRLMQLDPEQAEQYRQTFQVWQKHWKQKRLQWKQQALALSGKSVVVQHTTFSYLLRWLKLKPVADLEPAPGVSPTLSHLDALTQQLKAEKPLAIMHNWYQSDNSAHWLAKRISVPVLALPSTVSEKEGISTLDQLFDHLIAELRSAQP